MENVPSSAILAIVAIVVACLFGAFIFTVVTTQKDQGNQALNKVEAINTALDESTMTQYDGATVTGSQVLSAIKLLKGEKVSVVVNNGSGAVTYLYTANADGTLSAITNDYSTMIKNAKDKSNAAYITPSAQFIGSLTRGTNGAITTVTFTIESQVGAGGAGGAGGGGGEG